MGKFNDTYNKIINEDRLIITQRQRPRDLLGDAGAALGKGIADGMDKLGKKLHDKFWGKELSQSQLLEASKNMLNYVYFISPKSDLFRNKFEQWMGKLAKDKKIDQTKVSKAQIAYFMSYFMFIKHNNGVLKNLPFDLSHPIKNLQALNKKMKLNHQSKQSFEQIYRSIIFEDIINEQTDRQKAKSKILNLIEEYNTTEKLQNLFKVVCSNKYCKILGSEDFKEIVKKIVLKTCDIRIANIKNKKDLKEEEKKEKVKEIKEWASSKFKEVKQIIKQSKWKREYEQQCKNILKDTDNELEKYEKLKILSDKMKKENYDINQFDSVTKTEYENFMDKMNEIKKTYKDYFSTEGDD